MIKKIFNITLLIGVLVLTTQCQQSKPTYTGLYATIGTDGKTLNLQDDITIRFTVTNPTQDTLKFTAYHTPFEGIKSKFLTVTDSEGKEVGYLGPMVKRVTPAPEDTYHTLVPGQKVSITFNLKKAYEIDKAGSYILQYNGEKISGVANGEPVEITVEE
ncbi:hypothetical protein [Sinomicrobium sp.]